MLDKETAKTIWYCICNHSAGFSEDRFEWCYDNELDEEEVDKFVSMVDEICEAKSSCGF